MAITVKHKFVSAIPDAGDPTIVQPSNWNDDHQLSGTVPVANGGTGASTLTGYVKGNGTSAMTASTTVPNTDVTGLGTASTKDAGVANGVATLDSSGQVPLSQIPPLGDLNYQGTWNATTNSPTLTSSVGTKGFYYVVSVAGTTNLNGITDWQIGDWAVYNGSAWQKIDNTDAVTSVNGYTGTVVLTQSDISGTVPTSRTITAGTGLSGGGDLSANRTLAIANTGVTAATYGSANSVPVVAVNAQGQVTSATNTTIAIANTQVSGLGTMSTQNANSVAITGGSLNGVAIGGTTAGDGTFDILTANVSRLGIATGTSMVASNGLSSTSTFTGTAPTDGIVVDYSTGYGRFSAFTGDGYQWYTGGIANTKIMDITSAGALTTTGTVTANGVLLTGNLGTVTSVTGTSPVVSSGGNTPAISMPAATTSVNGYLTSTDWNTFNGKQASGTYVNSVSGTTGRITSTGGVTPVIDLASGVATAGTTGSSTLIPVITIDTYGRVTSITTAANPQGTVTSVTGTAPVVSSGGATPAISMAAATTSVNGYLTSTDWTTFNNKTSNTGTVTSVGGTGTVNGLTLTGTVTTSGNLTLGGTLDLSSPPAIGGTTAAAITGTTITATKYVGVSGGTF